MRHRKNHAGRAELGHAWAIGRPLFWAAGFFSVFVNLLMLTGPLYMLQVYDRVLASRSEETLLALSLLVLFLYMSMGLLDYARGRIVTRIGIRFRDRLDRRVFQAMLQKAGLRQDPEDHKSGLRDLEAIQQLLGLPAFIALFDIPWTPMFLLTIFLFHPALGLLATAGGILLIGLTWLNQRLTHRLQLEAGISALRAERLAEEIMNDAEMVQGLGLRAASHLRWSGFRDRAVTSALRRSDRNAVIASVTKSLRLVLQSAMLGLGAFLVLRGQMTAGGMIAASILLGRALAPIEVVIGQWALVQRAVSGWSSLALLLSQVAGPVARMPLPRPEPRLLCDQITLIPPGEKQASLRMLSFEVPPGKALGVIGPSGAGKSTLARALTGVWPVAAGKVRLGGAALDHYDPDQLARYIGYLPQTITLFNGTIRDNIARFDPDADTGEIIEAARKAAAHDLILQLPDGYDTSADVVRGRLSGGEMQRIGLARAMFGNPVLLVLDEPNSNLDNDGTAALNAAIKAMKARGNSVIIMAHRPSAILECDLLLALDHGMRRAFGPRDDVLSSTVQNYASIRSDTGMGGVI